MHHVIPFVNITIQWGKVCIEAQNQYYLLDDKLFLKIRDNWTKSPNLRAIDVWVILCYVGVFYCLMEYCIVLHLTKREKTMSSTSSVRILPFVTDKSIIAAISNPFCLKRFMDFGMGCKIRLKNYSVNETKSVYAN